MERIAQLEKEMTELSDIIDDKRSKFDFSTATSFKDFENIAIEEVEQWSKLSRELRMLRAPEMRPIPSYGNLMTMEEFKEDVDGGGFIDYDGSGNYSDGKEMTNITINPSDIQSNEYRKDFTHVVWFNK